MTKRMSITKIVEQERKFREKYPNPRLVKKEFVDMRGDLVALIKASEYTRLQVAKKLGISENLLFGKMQNPHRWKMEEIDKLLDLLF